MFRFNFSNSLEDNSTEKPEEHSTPVNLNEVSKNCPSTLSCKYIPVDNCNYKDPLEKNLQCARFSHVEIKYITQKTIEDRNLEVLHQSNSDLLPGKYEGGLKVWECSVDLTQFLAEENCIHSGDEVLELGCGVGLPGIFAYLCGAVVTFQDFNAEVLELVTAPNVILNTPEELRSTIHEKCKFLCGDWGCIKKKYYSESTEIKQFDVILTSETIYEKCNHRKLLELMKMALKPTGVIYLASKVHYFGVGGGIADFEELVKEDGSLEFSTVFQTSEGVQRWILKLKFKENLN